MGYYRYGYSTWYSPPSLTSRYYPDKISALELAYKSWYREAHGKDYEPMTAPPSDIARTTLLKPVKALGEKEGLPVTVRAVSFVGQIKTDWRAGADRCIDAVGKEFKHYASAAPVHYVVSHGGNRLDSFLSSRNAKAFAEKFLALA